MKIVIAGSMSLSSRMVEIERELVERGHQVTLPEHTHEYAIMQTDDHRHKESAKNKINEDLIRKYYQKIKEGDALLVVNETKYEIENYIGCNTFIEMVFAHQLRKHIYVLNPLPDISYINDELKALEPDITVLAGDYNLVK